MWLLPGNITANSATYINWNDRATPCVKDYNCMQFLSATAYSKPMTWLLVLW